MGRKKKADLLLDGKVGAKKGADLLLSRPRFF